jgi:hypothetical protein
MERITRTLSRSFKPVRLYLDDIEEIVTIIKEIDAQPKIQVEDFRLDNLEEMTSLKKDMLHEMNISSTRPYISLEMRPSWIRLYISEDKAESRGIFEKIRTILVSRKRPFTWIIHNSFLYSVWCILALYGVVWGVRLKSIILTASFAIIFILAIVFTIYGINDQFKRYTIIIPKYKQDSPNFIKRNRDKIIIAIISAIIGAVLSRLL